MPDLVAGRLVGKEEFRRRILAAFGVTEAEVAALGGAGYDAAMAQAREDERRFGEHVVAMRQELWDRAVAFWVEHGRMPTEDEIAAIVAEVVG